eukprot:2226016-Rhodomonas_salina.1
MEMEVVETIPMKKKWGKKRKEKRKIQKNRHDDNKVEGKAKKEKESQAEPDLSRLLHRDAPHLIKLRLVQTAPPTTSGPGIP